MQMKYDYCKCLLNTYTYICLEDTQNSRMRLGICLLGYLLARDGYRTSHRPGVGSMLGHIHGFDAIGGFVGQMPHGAAKPTHLRKAKGQSL